jgi:hypothetical protein
MAHEIHYIFSSSLCNFGFLFGNKSISAGHEIHTAANKRAAAVFAVIGVDIFLNSSLRAEHPIVPANPFSLAPTTQHKFNALPAPSEKCLLQPLCIVAGMITIILAG